MEDDENLTMGLSEWTLNMMEEPEAQSSSFFGDDVRAPSETTINKSSRRFSSSIAPNGSIVNSAGLGSRSLFFLPDVDVKVV